MIHWSHRCIQQGWRITRQWLACTAQFVSTITDLKMLRSVSGKSMQTPAIGSRPSLYGYNRIRQKYNLFREWLIFIELSHTRLPTQSSAFDMIDWRRSKISVVPRTRYGLSEIKQTFGQSPSHGPSEKEHVSYTTALDYAVSKDGNQLEWPIAPQRQ